MRRRVSELSRRKDLQMDQIRERLRIASTRKLAISRKKERVQEGPRKPPGGTARCALPRLRTEVPLLRDAVRSSRPQPEETSRDPNGRTCWDRNHPRRVSKC